MTAPQDYAALIARLRKFPEFFQNGGSWQPGVVPEPTCLEAADAIIALLAERDALRADLATLVDDCAIIRRRAETALAALADCKAKNERLKRSAIIPNAAVADMQAGYEATLAALRERAGRAERDAVRYRWLRSHSYKRRESQTIVYSQVFDQTAPEILDTAIDAALAAQSATTKE